MCGIVGYVGPNEATGFLLEGLRRLEYRGYDSSGVATLEEGGEILITKTDGRIEDLALSLEAAEHFGGVGIGHTRWATHGPANHRNAHPHLGGDAVLALVHNGVIENCDVLKCGLVELGYEFHSDTDSEVVAHLIAAELDAVMTATNLGDSRDPHAPLVVAVRAAVAKLRGTYGLAIVFRDWPDAIIAARLGSPLVIGVGEGENFIASDGSPLVGYTDKIIYLSDHEIAVVTADSIRLHSRDKGPIRHDIKLLDIDESQVGLNGFPHYMLKEIFEQPESIRNAMRGRLDEDEATAKFGGLNLLPQAAAARRPARAHGLRHELARGAGGRVPDRGVRPHPGRGRVRQRAPLPQPADVDATRCCSPSPSRGETIDTLAALREMQAQGPPDAGHLQRGGQHDRPRGGRRRLPARRARRSASPRPRPITSQCVVLALLALYFGRLQHLSFEAGLRIIERAQALPEQVEQALDTNNEARRIAAKYAELQQLPLPGPAVQLPHGARGRAQAQGNQLHPRRGLPGGRDEARPDRPGRRANAQRLHRAPRRRLRQGDRRTWKRSKPAAGR